MANRFVRIKIVICRRKKLEIELLSVVARDKFFKRVKIRRDKGLGNTRYQITLLLSAVWLIETLSQNFMIFLKVKSELELEF